MPAPHTDSTCSRYALEGRVVTMDDHGTVLDHGTIYIDQGAIAHVRASSEPAPAGFDGCPVVHTGGTIYPGLIELHNHLSYNVLPPWEVPERFLHHGQWKRRLSYKRTVTKPMSVLGRSPGLPAAIVRYVESKCLMAGVTTSQGITLNSYGGIRRLYRGLVRNVEQSGEDALPSAATRIAAVGPGEAAKIGERLAKTTCFLHHLSEGINDTAYREYLRLRICDDTWAIGESYAGIHSLALHGEDFRRIANLGGSVIWSPMSNLMLYGKTLDLRAVGESGVRLGIGSDWSPSGSKNLLGELKVAHLVSQHQDARRGPVFTPRELVAMATSNAARILRWDTLLGSIEPGKRADLLVVNGQRGEPYEHLLRCRETSIVLVVIDGVARYGQQRWMQRLVPAADCEAIRVGRSRRVLNLRQDSADPIVSGLSLGTAQRTLRDAMRRLPALARDLAQPPAGFIGGSLDDQGEIWTLDLEQDAFDPEGDAGIHPALTEQGFDASMPLADTPSLEELVEPTRLDPLTMADDPWFFRSLAVQPNLPDYVKKGLPPLYGKRPFSAQSTVFYQRCPRATRERIDELVDLRTFLHTTGELRLADRKRIVEQAIVLLEQHYVHLPLKKAMHGIDPVQRLKLLLYRLEETQEEHMPPELELHEEMLEIFHSLRDLHTNYLLPAPYRERTAFLPFLVEECFDAGVPRYVVTKLLADAGPAGFVPGVEIHHWNGMPIQHEIERNAERQAGSNRAARHARGLAALTIRPLASSPPPEEEWVTIGYRTLDGEERELRQRWLVARVGPGRDGKIDLDALEIDAMDDASLAGALAMGLDYQTDAVQEVRKVLFAAQAVDAEQEVARAGKPRQADVDALETTLPGVLRARVVSTERGDFGYLRIFTFHVRDADAFVRECARLVEQLPQAGLVIDVRGNGGGLIHAAERLLQLFTPKRIEPQRAQFINTPANLDLCRKHAPSPVNPGLDLSPWEKSIHQSVATGATYSRASWITSPESCNAIGQRYYGPVMLITDALCYSATDMFAAGFQDHGIGPILGTSANTGAGGANVWSHRQLGLLMGAALDGSGEERGDRDGTAYAALPQRAGMRVAIRRTLRVGPEAGTLVEDLGVEPDCVHLMSRRDVLEDNRDLVNAALGLLAGKQAHPVRMALGAEAGAPPCITVWTHDIDRVHLFIDGIPCGARRPVGGVARFDVPADGLARPHADTARSTLRVEVEGWEGDHLVAFRREDLAVPPDARGARGSRRTRPGAGACRAAPSPGR